MVRELNKTTTLTGSSGTQYTFNLWSFEDFDDVKGAFRGSGLYLFTKRYFSEGVYRHKYLYLGETGNYSTRYDNHHKEDDIREHDSNCIGFLSMQNSSEDDRKEFEEDILSAYNFPCNAANN